MAAPSTTVWGSIAGGYGRIGIYSYVNSTSTSTTVYVEVWFWSKYSVSDSANTLYYDNLDSAGSATTSRGAVSIDTTVASGTGWNDSNQMRIGSYNYSYNRGTSAVTRYLRAKLTGVDRVGGTMTAGVSVTIPKLDSWTVSYNANGGTGAPSSQTKWYGRSLTLSTTKPTRTGYTFQGWGISSGDAVDYASGAAYTTNTSVTLYAVWKANTYKVSYNANGGTGAPSSQTKTYGVSLTLSSTIPTRTNYVFLGWGASAAATVPVYSPGSTYTINSAVTLYAIWELAYTAPRVVNLLLSRCDSDGTLNDEGTNALVSFDWECDKAGPTIEISWALVGDGVAGSVTKTTTGTSDAANYIVGDSVLSAESSYDICVTVTDSGGSSYVYGTLSSRALTIDSLAGGKGVAFGKAAELENTAEFEFDGKFNGAVYGNALGMNRLPEIPVDSDMNNYMATGCYAVYTNSIATTIANIPVAKAGRLEVWSSTGEGVSSEKWTYLRQRYIPYRGDDAVWERDITRSSDNVWDYGDWYRSSLTPTASQFIYDNQRMLWGSGRTTGLYMNAQQTAELAETVSSQRHGIVLVFCAYDDEDNTNYGWQSFFVPKSLVLASASGHTFSLSRGRFSYIGTKYLYITDEVVKGHADNTATGTSNGITYANNRFVLRYIWGV